MCKNVACSSPRRCHSNGLSFLSLACSCVDFVVTVRMASYWRVPLHLQLVVTKESSRTGDERSNLAYLSYKPDHLRQLKPNKKQNL